MIETSALWDHEAMVKRQAMLPPWTPAIREQVRRELRQSPVVEVALYPYPRVNGEIGQCTKVVDPQPTVLREERKARAANVAHYCRKCRDLGTKRHHAMCPKRGYRSGNVWRNPELNAGRILKQMSLEQSPMHYVIPTASMTYMQCSERAGDEAIAGLVTRLR